MKTQERTPDPRTADQARAGLLDGRWQVRRASVTWLHRHGRPQDLHALVPLLRDPRARVRARATIAIALDAGRCSVAGLEPVPLLIERALVDESPRVRRLAVTLLAWRYAHPHLEGFSRQLLDRERDPDLHKRAGMGLFLCAKLAGHEPC